MDTLITSSYKTLMWLSTIKSKVEEKNLFLKYNETQYWASFWSPKTKRVVSYLQPQKTQIRLFTRLDSSFNFALQATPSSHNWANMYPSIFIVKSKDLINQAVEFIISSYEEDLRKDIE